MKSHSPLIVIPAYNEENNIVRLIREIQSLDINMDILVVDDGSTDGTALRAVEMGVRVLSLPFNIGVGAAVQTGLKAAVRGGYERVVRVDGDGQHDPMYISALLMALDNNEADLVVGSRFLPPYLGYQSSVVRRIGINFFSYLISFLVGIKVTDPTSGFLAYNRRMIEMFARNYPYDFPEPETIVVAKRYDARVREVPVQMRVRRSGRSSIRYLVTLYYMIKVTFAILLNMIKKRERF